MLGFASLGLSVPVAAVEFNLGINGDVRAVQAGNVDQTQLAALGLTHKATTNASLLLSSSATLSFAFMGSHSGPEDQFVAANGRLLMTENTAFMPWNPIALGEMRYRAGPIADRVFSYGNPSFPTRS